MLTHRETSRKILAVAAADPAAHLRSLTHVPLGARERNYRERSSRESAAGYRVFPPGCKRWLQTRTRSPAVRFPIALTALDAPDREGDLL